MSYIRARSTMLEVIASRMIGASAGLTLRYHGLLGRLAGSCPRAALIAAWTSRAAASMLRFNSNWMVMLVEPSEEDDVISVMPAITPNGSQRAPPTAHTLQP